MKEQGERGITHRVMEQTTEKLIKIAGVRFRENWKVYDFDATDIEVAVGDRVIVDSERGPGFAAVVRIRKTAAPVGADVPEPPAPPVKPEIPEGIEIEIEEEEQASSASAKNKGPKAIRKILRKATEDDVAREAKNREREAEAFRIAQDMITEREMPMKLIRVDYSFDASRATFFFFSENRVDFRELVKDLAYKLKSRIEMRQIGVRDVARMIGGFGPCGRELCCSSFLKNFEPVSIRMAKKQEMVLNPAKISGVCGRLLCCLSYEYEMYEANKKDLADLRQSAIKEKKDEEERRIAEERKEAEAQRTAEEKKRQEERRQQPQRRDKQKEGGQKAGGRPEKKKEQQEKGAQPSKAEQQQQRQRSQQPRSDQKQQDQKQQDQKQQPQVQQVQQPKEQKAQQQAGQEGEKSGKRKRRRFWRKKKKSGPGGEGQAPQGPKPAGGN
jgi:cell fate regulator YaaT (PSP1 superfamily)